MRKFNLHTHLLGKNALVNGYLETYKPTEKWYSLGIHPWYIPQNWKDVLIEFENKINKDKNILAIGECGLDKLCLTGLEKQKEVFKGQISLAEKTKKPLIIHCVKAHNECEKLLSKVAVPVIFHGFNKKRTVLNQLKRHTHFYFSFGIPKPSMIETIKSCPLDRLFLETDDENIEIESVYRQIAEIKGVTLDRLENQILLNREKVFGI